MSITRELAEILGDVNRPGDYYVAGRADFPAPRLEVEGVGPIALPLLAAQAAQLIKIASSAPYGRGSETVIDTKVRRTWQIEANRVGIGGKHWSKTLDGIVARAAEGLGVTGPVTAEQYKLLVYDKGSFFVSHRDTEKVPGMFATLVLSLPSHSDGGELVVRHKDREVRLDLRCEEPSEIAFAAFYADCAKADNAAILEAASLFPQDQAAELLRAIVAANAVEGLGACAALLANALKGPFAKQPAKIVGAAQTLIDALPGDPTSAPTDQWGRPRPSSVDVALVVDLVTVVDGVDRALAERTAAHLVAWPLHFGLDAVLVPASKTLQQSRRIGAASRALHATAVAHLAARIAEPLQPPKDWTRPSRVDCGCPHCTELAKFLADPAHGSWTFKAVQHDRSHVENTIRRAQADVDTRTERKGSPHSLICRKNQASYQRRVAQREQDLADIALLRG